MSGVEIIGLILGGLPLAISAIEHYRDGLDPVKDYFRYESTLKSLRIRLRIQQDLFEGTLRRLLLEDLSDSQARALFPDLGNGVDRKLWGTDDVDYMLHRRLDNKYTNFMDVIGEMEVVMRRLMEKLDVDIDEKASVARCYGRTSADPLRQPKWNDNSPTTSEQALKRSRWEWRRIRRSFGRKDREALIQDFERYNNDIARYVEQREILAPPSKPKPEEFSKYYHLVRNNACGLYDVLEDGWKCRCISAHNANLQLERRTDAHAAPGFKLSLSFLHRSSQDHPGQKAWLEAKIDVDELEEETVSPDREDLTVIDPNPSPAPVLPLNTACHTNSVSLPFAIRKSTCRSVKIIEPANNTKRMPQFPSMQNTRSGVMKPRRAPRILSLCEAIRAAQIPNINLGFLANMASKRCIHITTTTILTSSDVIEPVSLDSLLASSKIPRQRATSSKLSRQQRLSIAVTLAHGVLQLHKSPWLNETWSKKDIYFFFHGTDTQGRPIIEQPCVSRSFRSTTDGPKEIESSGINATDIFSSQIINKSLFALGIVLIELCFNKPFEDLCAEARDPDLPASDTPPDTAEIYAVATSLIDDVYNEQGTQYGYVVQRCLKCEFGVQDSKKQLDFDTFRALVYEGVLAPLEEDLKRYSL